MSFTVFFASDVYPDASITRRQTSHLSVFPAGNVLVSNSVIIFCLLIKTFRVRISTYYTTKCQTNIHRLYISYLDWCNYLVVRRKERNGWVN